MRVTTWAEYGLLVSLNLAKRAGQGPVAARELAEHERLPHDYVEQILLRLRRAGLVDSVRGAKGGYHLAREPQAITVKDVIEASEHVTFEVNCDLHRVGGSASQRSGVALDRSRRGYDGLRLGTPVGRGRLELAVAAERPGPA